MRRYRPLTWRRYLIIIQVLHSELATLNDPVGRSPTPRMAQSIEIIGKRAGRIIHLARDCGPSHGARPLIRQTNHLVTQLSGEAQAQGNMSNPSNIPLHVTSDIVGDINARSGSSHRSGNSMTRFLCPPEARSRKGTHDESTLTEVSILSSNLLTPIGSPDQEPPHVADISTATSDHPSEAYTQGLIWASKFQSDALARFLDPRSEAPWTSEDPGRRERVAENLWMENELLCTSSDDKL